MVEGVETSLRLRIPVLGVPVEFETDSPEVRDAVDAALGQWHALPDDLISLPRRLPRIRLDLLTDPPDPPGPPAPVTVRSPSAQQLVLEGRVSRGGADGAALTGWCTVTPAMIDQRQLFEETILSPLSLFLVTRCDRQPFHAAAVSPPGTERDMVLLLTGPSGSGKSTLAYAALRRGWTVVSDDAVYLQSHPVPRIWTRPPRLHLPVGGSWHFPELDGRPVVRRENGRLKVQAECEAAWSIAARPFSRATLCLLGRSTGGEPTVEPIDRESAIRAVLQSLEPGFDVFRDTIASALRATVRHHCWQVGVTSSPDSVLEQLDRTIDASERA
jgi:hypothetical protein